MIIWTITATYQGVNDGVQIATLDEGHAQEEYERLVRESMNMLDEDWEDVEAAYDDATANGAKVEEYLLEGVVVA